MTTDSLQILLILATLEVLLVELWLIRWQYRAGRKLGPVIQRSSAMTGARVALAAPIFLLAVLSFVPALLSDGPTVARKLIYPAFTLLSMSSLVFLLSPRRGDLALGRTGVRSGWTVARFGEFVEWRLTGAHLRFRLEGKLWEAVEVSADQQAALRTRLECAAPGRESRYTE